MVRLSNDYFIEVQKAMPPKVRVSRPGRDAKVNPIEEVTITVQAEDDFALRGMDLHYSVNGGSEKTVSLGGAKGKKAEGSTTLYLEDHKLVPGDIVSFYGTARDALATSRTDMFFIQAEPFEREYSQAQQMGGGGAGDQAPPSSEHQKEIIAATWNEIKNPPKDKAVEDENAKLLSSIQSKLRDQAKSLASRMQSRDMSASNPAIKSFADDMAQAVEAMGQASARLGARDWQGALTPEQKSLQHLSRAEATFRDIQVAFGNSNGGGRGGAGRDLEGLFDLELDREKNQYETGQNSTSPDQHQKEMEETLAKLEELARRQQELADQRRQNQQAYEQRWQQELLRREAEELRRKMEQMARNQSGAQSSQSQQGQQSSQTQPSQQSQQGSGQSATLNRALQRLQEAARDMQKAGSSQSQGSAQSEAEARRAAERLREAREMLAGERKQQATGEMSDLARKTEQLAGRQQQFENNLRQMLSSSGQPGTSRQQTAQMRDEQQKLLDELTRLEEEAQRAARDMAGSQPSASGKLRDALGELQQQELRLKMKWSLEVMRRGMAEYALPREMAVTQGLNQMRDRVREAQGALDRQQPGGQDVESALARAEQLRRQLEQMRNGASQKGQQGQTPNGQSGQTPESQGAQSATGSPAGGIRPGGGAPGIAETDGRGIDSAYADRIFRDGVRDLTQLDQMLRGNPDVPRETSRDVQDLVRQMQRLDPRLLAADPTRLDQIVGQLLGGVEQVELELRRIADAQQSGSVRSGASQPVPPGYADAVAEYFRRLAAQK
jgi:hypothetical protein